MALPSLRTEIGVNHQSVMKESAPPVEWMCNITKALKEER
jgi:hypothetical protein